MRLGNDNLASSPARCVTCGARINFESAFRAALNL